MIRPAEIQAFPNPNMKFNSITPGVLKLGPGGPLSWRV